MTVDKHLVHLSLWQDWMALDIMVDEHLVHLSLWQDWMALDIDMTQLATGLYVWVPAGSKRLRLEILSKVHRSGIAFERVVSINFLTNTPYILTILTGGTGLSRIL